MSSPTTDRPEATDDDAAVLRIVSGLHTGATRPLSRREMVLIGSGDDCDVVLADLGVAPHHALLNAVDGRFHLRALDAPVELPGGTLHPGDPVEVGQVQRIALGQAAIAFGRADAVEWLTLAPEPGADAPLARPRPAFANRMPLIAGIAVLALSALAIVAALMPAPAPEVDVEHRLRALAQEFDVGDVVISRDVEGRIVLSGTVDDSDARTRFQSRIASEEMDASVALRSGQDLAVDVAEVMRTGGYAVRAEYLGNNNVRVSGRFGEDDKVVREFITSRAMIETGVNMVEPVNLDQPAPDAVADADAGAVMDGDKAHIVSIVRGETPHIIDAEGNVYHDGAAIPGWGELVSIGQFAHVIQADGTLVKLTPSPAPRAPVEEEAPPAQAPEAEPTTGMGATAAAPLAGTGRKRAAGAEDTM
ncbi:FHA domain-containing protein [Luteimonas sp. A611]